jgi:hypothetical protein
VGEGAFYDCKAVSPTVKAEIEKRFGKGVFGPLRMD